jgi:outer membrane lipoprotein SlyB|tara:strand:+ start:345 stop:791 length:447 start_codon:yes stop_codon:yes gene_type:complete
MKKSLIALLLLSGCASQGVDRDDQGHIIKHYYATVESIEKVKLSSEIGTGIMVGAGIGLAEDLDGNTEDMISGAIAGALIGGLFTALFEGGNTAYQYTLNDVDNGEFIVIQKTKLPKSTRCVRVKTGNKVKLEATNDSFCLNINNTKS